MGKKFLLSVLGIGAGVYWVKREINQNPDGAVAHWVAKVKNNPTVQEKVDTVKSRATEVVQKQGQKVTDKVADVVKERLFGAPGNQSEEVVIEVEAVDVTDTATQK